MQTVITRPVAPRIPVSLSAWDGKIEDETDIDNAQADDVSLIGVGRLTIATSRIRRAFMAGAVLDKLEMTDAESEKIEGAALRTYKPRFLRVHVSDSRFTGSEFAEGYFEDCTFRNVKFDETGFRFAAFKRVHFEGCVLRQADFTGAKLTDITFDDCIFEGATFTSTSCKNVDVSGEDLTLVHGLLGLKGAIISAEQLVQLAPLFASELGFHVKE